jgi:hypothetical protein
VGTNTIHACRKGTQAMTVYPKGANPYTLSPEILAMVCKFKISTLPTDAAAVAFQAQTAAYVRSIGEEPKP